MVFKTQLSEDIPVMPDNAFVYNSVVVPDSGGAAVTLRTAILALSGGAIPTKPIIGGWLIPASGGVAATIMFSQIGDTPLTTNAGGGKITIAAGATFDLLPSDPLDKVWLISSGAASTCTLVLWTD
jgi:hypothetical protein